MRQDWAALIFTAGFLVAALIAAIILDCKEFMLYLALAPFMVGFIAYLYRKINLPVSMLWALSALVVVHCIGGLTTLPSHFPTEGKPFLYNLWLIPGKLKYDQIVHAYGNGLATWMCWNLLRYSISMAVKTDIKDIPARPVFLLLCFLAGTGFSALNEVLEFGATQAVPGDHNVGGYVNTGWDLVFNTIGGGIAVFMIWLKRRDGRLPAVNKRKASSKLKAAHAS